MSNSWKIERMKYCRIEKNGDKTKYYVVVDGQPVEVEKEVYYVIERSYHKEWLFKHGKNSKYVSLEKLAEDEEGNILHDRVPVALRLRLLKRSICCPKKETMKMKRSML